MKLTTFAALVSCALAYAAAVGFFCPARFQPLLIVLGLCPIGFVAIVILGAREENV